ncbi:retron system putative HNH endonuclease [Treponema sp. C6A8]|uniref:retron system putative HNH endonuclease n=1 Tax=Treponema sp. C6A8 TaxID=1410609 RepID=UPI0006882F36|nr:retron system putative HNH endonuclease [Treponema sp. C6A8]
MIYIQKHSSPKVLIELKKEISKGKSFESVIETLKSQNKTVDFYDNISDKEPIRESLLDEQNNLCAYCMASISKDDMKIEHFKSQSVYPQYQLDYSNMLGCCKGNEGKPNKLQTCDSYKGNKELSLNPSVKADFEKMELIYLEDGTISSRNESFNKELDDVLNLNAASLKAKRKEMIDSAKQQLNYKNNSRSKAFIEKLIQKYKTQHKPYYGAAVYYLEKKLKNAK